MNMRKNYKRIAFLAFAMYFLTGAACIVVGSSLPHLVKMYNMELNKVVLMGSAYAVGRVSTVYITGRMVEKNGPMKVLALGAVLIGIFLFGIPTFVNYYAGMAFAFLGGVGMGAQDTVCPVLLSRVFTQNYAGAMSAGQALFGLGNFAMPFLVGVMLSGKLPFYYSYYVLILVPIAILVCIPFVKFEPDAEGEGQEEEKIHPLYTKKKALAYGAILVICVAYSAVVNTLMLYISSFAESIGVSLAKSAFMLTAYNVGCFAGSLAFILILRKVKEQSVLVWNNVLAALALSFMLIVNRVPAYFAGVSAAGFFLGVLFSVIVTVATRIDHEHISRASSLIATVGGASDILTPVITGALVGRLGVGVSFKYVILLILVTIAAGMILKINTTENTRETVKGSPGE